jgi:hypothetical protein
MKPETGHTLRDLFFWSFMGFWVYMCAGAPGLK